VKWGLPKHIFLGLDLVQLVGAAQAFNQLVGAAQCLC